MKLTKPQLTLSVVLAIGVAAIVVDKFVIGYSDPSSASAATSPGSSLLVQPEKPTSTAIAPQTVPDTPSIGTSEPKPAIPARQLVPLASKIASLDAVTPSYTLVNDPFETPTVLAPKTQKPEAAAPVAIDSTPIEPASPFENDRTLHLSMVMVPKAGVAEAPVAVINGSPYPLGSTVRGYTIVSVTKDRVLLSKDDRFVELSLPTPEAAIRRD